MRDAVMRDCIFERFGDVLLADKIVESLWPPLTRYDLITHEGDSPEIWERWNASRREELRVNCGTQGIPGTVAPFRAWRGSRDLVAQSPKFHAPADARISRVRREKSSTASRAQPECPSRFNFDLKNVFVETRR